jgi:hypothetical protein
MNPRDAVSRPVSKISVAAAIGFIACTEGPLPSPPAVSIDTIGSVVHVWNAAPESLDTLRKVVMLGKMGGVSEVSPEEFGRITSVLVSADGTVYVADGQALEVRVFTPQGHFLRTIGRAGAGPGEFRALYALAWVGDTLLSLDSRNARVSVFDSEGQFLTTWPWLPLTGPVDFVRFYPVGPGDAYTLGLRSQPVHATTYVRFTPEGPQDTLDIPAAPQPQTNVLRCPRDDGGISFFTVPFAGRRLIAPAPDGHFVVAWSAIYRVALLSSAGDTVRVIERDYAPIPVSDAMWEDATGDYDKFHQEWPSSRCDPPSMSRPEFQSALQGLFFDQLGRLVVEVTASGGTRYDYYDHQGWAVKSVLAPRRDPSVAPYFRGTYIAQVEQDSLGVQHVTVLQHGN